MIFKKAKKITAVIITGILMPIFLLVAIPKVSANNDSSKENDIIFATHGSVPPYLNNASFLFGGYGAPNTFRAKVNLDEFNWLKNDPKIIYAVVDSQITVSEILTNDPFFTTNAREEDRQWYLEKIKLPEAWVYGTGSRSVKVAVIDTGIHATHLELNDGRIVEGYNVLTDKIIPAGTNSDDNGHGTAVAGVIGAISNNKIGIAGVNWDVSIIPVKALQANGSGAISSIARAITWAADNGAHIINLSLGGPGFGDDQTLNNSIIYAYNKGSLIVAAAGNDLADNGINLDTAPVYPVCADGGNNMVIGVAASDVNDQKASFSNFGINCVDIIAPGKKILTTAFIPTEPSDNILIYGSGTSLATPVVSGVAALLKANNPSLTNTQIKNIILKTADNIDVHNQKSCLGLSCNGFLGKGRINALLALTPQPLLEGVLVKETSTGLIYQISGGEKRLVYDFVFKQRGFSLDHVVNESNGQLIHFLNGTPLLPLEGTLVKGQTDSTVYYIDKKVKRALTYLVFQSRNYKFSDIKIIPESELISFPTGDWYWPPDGVMVLIKGNPTVYVMENEVKRPVTYFVFTQRRLSFARVVTVTPDEFSHIPNPPDSYWLPPFDGTLLKSDANAVVYIIVQGARRPLTYEAFVSRKLDFKNVKVLPQAEIDVISEGPTLHN